MYLVTDTPEFAQSLFPLNMNWQAVQKKSFNIAIQNLVENLFADRALFISELPFRIAWKWFFVVRFAPSSQFELLKTISLSSHKNDDNILCFAGSGDNFKGYRDRKWVTLPGNIHLAGWFRPGRLIENFHTGFTILSAVSAIQAIDLISGLEKKAMIRWVNDLVIGRAKVGGVLTQTRSQGAIVTDAFIGIGLNVNAVPEVPADLFVPETTSLVNHREILKIDISEVMMKLITCLDHNYRLLLDNGYNLLLDFYRERCCVLGRQVEIYTDPISGNPQRIGKGVIRGIGKNLELYLDNSPKPVTHGRLVLL